MGIESTAYMSRVGFYTSVLHIYQGLHSKIEGMTCVPVLVVLEDENTERGHMYCRTSVWICGCILGGKRVVVILML